MYFSKNKISLHIVNMELFLYISLYHRGSAPRLSTSLFKHAAIRFLDNKLEFWLEFGVQIML